MSKESGKRTTARRVKELIDARGRGVAVLEAYLRRQAKDTKKIHNVLKLYLQIALQRLRTQRYDVKSCCQL